MQYYFNIVLPLPDTKSTTESDVCCRSNEECV